MKKIVLLWLMLGVFVNLFAQQSPITPLEKSKYTALSSYDDLMLYLHELSLKSKLMKMEVIGQSVEGRNLLSFIL